MKLEKINDNQICCTISGKDLEANKIKLSELAFGSEKAKEFFRGIMLRAEREFGFKSANVPLMVEAIPQLPDSLKLIVTKINHPHGEDFLQDPDADGAKTPAPEIRFTGADGVLNLFKKIKKAREEAVAEANEGAKKVAEADSKAGRKPDFASLFADAADIFGDDPLAEDLTGHEAFRFSDVDSVIPAAKALKGFYDGENSLYKETAQSTCLLVLHCVDETPEDFNRICNILSEYGTPIHCSENGEYYFREHDNTIIEGNALQILADF